MDIASVSRSVQYWLGINDIEWRILHDEQAEATTIIATYRANMEKGIKDPAIIAKYAKRKRIAGDIAENVALKLATFWTNYHATDKKVSFLNAHTDEWKTITEIDIERARFIVTEYPQTLLLPEIVTTLKDRIEKIQAIIDSIENSDKK